MPKSQDQVRAYVLQELDRVSVSVSGSEAAAKAAYDEEQARSTREAGWLGLPYHPRPWEDVSEFVKDIYRGRVQTTPKEAR